MEFKVHKELSRPGESTLLNGPRLGTLTTAHSEIATPVFMPVGTRGSVKALGQDELEGELQAKIILGNTYHLFIRPGADLIERVAGDLHRFIGYSGSLLTDSGGYQVYSLKGLRKMTPDGVWFQSHVDGTKHFLGPKESMAIQKSLGSDIVMCFDECPALPATRDELARSLAVTLKWEKICREYSLKSHQALFGIIQGGLEMDLRVESLQALLEHRSLEDKGYEGLAIGGLSVGEKNNEMYEFLEKFVLQMPRERPRYLMGVGTPVDIIQAVSSGIDMFDCVLPTRNGRNGQIFTANGTLSIKNKRFQEDTLPPDPDCTCKICRRYSRAYLRHLFLVGEMLALQAITYHNVFFYLNLMEKIRNSIANETFWEFSQNFIQNYNSGRWK